jgi:hypothetical protein
VSRRSVAGSRQPRSQSPRPDHSASTGRSGINLPPDRQPKAEVRSIGVGSRDRLLAAAVTPDSSPGRCLPSPGRVHTWIVGAPVSRAKLEQVGSRPVAGKVVAETTRAASTSASIERSVPQRVQRCQRRVLCRNLLSMIPRERKRCDPLVETDLRRVARDTQAGRDRTPPQGLDDLLARRARRRNAAPRWRSSDDQ